MEIYFKIKNKEEKCNYFTVFKYFKVFKIGIKINGIIQKI